MKKVLKSNYQHDRMHLKGYTKKRGLDNGGEKEVNADSAEQCSVAVPISFVKSKISYF